MRVLGRSKLSEFAVKHPPARNAFAKWTSVVEAAVWSSLPEVRHTFSSADYVAPFVVFNVGGNKYRLVALVEYTLKVVQIEHAFTHEQYNQWES